MTTLDERVNPNPEKISAPAILFGLLCSIAIAVRLLLMNHEDYLEDDTFITLRFARNIAEGAGYAFNPGEPVYGASSPLYTFLLSIFALIVPKETLPVVALSWSIASIVLAAIVIWKWFPFNIVGRFIAVIGVLGYPRLVYSSISGMEECFILLLICISFAACVRKWEILAAISLGLLLVAKLDTGVWCACLLIAYGLQRKRIPVRAALIAACILVPWLLYAQLTFGSLIPHTIAAKQVAFPYNNSGLADILFALLPQGMQNVTNSAMLGLVLVIVIISTIVFGIRRKNFLILAFPLYCIVYSLVLLASHTSPTLWSRWVVPLWGCLILSGGYVAGIVSERFSIRSSAMRIALPFVLAGCLFVLPFLRSRAANESKPYREVAFHLQQNAKPDESIMLEPIGLIGFESDLYVHDFVGLVTPGVTTARRESGLSNRWYVRYLQIHSPTYVLLRVFEFQTNQFGYGSGYGGGIFNGNERQWFERQYALVFTTSPPELQNAFMLFKRRD